LILSNIISGRIAYVHARLKRLAASQRLAYQDVTDMIVTRIRSAGAVGLLVPTFTISTFQETRCFDVQETPSEEGRFSEECRRNFCKFRTPDPMYSIADVDGLLCRESGIRYDTSYGPESIFSWLEQHDGVLINIDLKDDLRFTSHEPELRAGVPYRFLCNFAGQIRMADCVERSVNYKAFLRRRDSAGVERPAYNRRAILQIFREAGVVGEIDYCGFPLQWMYAKKATAALCHALERDKNIMVLDDNQ
jgi:aminoglycoside N3'-acetyltransferase